MCAIFLCGSEHLAIDIPLDVLRAELSSQHDRELEEVRQQHCSEMDRHKKQLQDLLEQRKKEVRFCHYSKSPPPSNIASTFHVVRCTVPIPSVIHFLSVCSYHCLHQWLLLPVITVGVGHMKDQHKVEECNNAFRATPLFQSAHKHSPVYPGQIHWMTCNCTPSKGPVVTLYSLMPSLYCQSVTIKWNLKLQKPTSRHFNMLF